MKIFKNKLFLPLAAAALLAGYGLSERSLPRYAAMEGIESSPSHSSRFQFSWKDNEKSLQDLFFKKSPSGNYLAAQFARSQKDWESAHDYMDQVLRIDAQNDDLKKTMMLLTMEGGYTNRSLALAKEVLVKEPENMLAMLFLTVHYLKSENYIEAKKSLDSISINNPISFIVPVLELWIHAAKGKLTPHEAEKNSFYLQHFLLAAHYLNMSSDAVLYAEKNISNIDIDFRDVEKLADLLAVMGGQDTALKLYKSFIDKAYATTSITHKVSTIKNGGQLDQLISKAFVESPKQGAAKVFLDMATIMFREGSEDSAIIFAQMALYLNEKSAEAQLIVANSLSRHQQYERAVDYLNRIQEDSSQYKRAQKLLADIYVDQNDMSEAVDTLENLYQETGDVEALVEVGHIYRYEEDYEQSVKIYSKVIKKIESSKEGTAEYWHVYYARGMAYERLKRFNDSEEDLLKALEYRPDHPYLLNYLGYSWVDQGRNLTKSLEMLKQAADAKSDDGYIIDSLGWAYYKMGEIELAISHLEDAVELLPYDATVNDHLGDAYWISGRRLEAQFQWRRALNYSEENEEELKVSIQEKLKNGLSSPEIQDAKTQADQKSEEAQTL